MLLFFFLLWGCTQSQQRGLIDEAGEKLADNLFVESADLLKNAIHLDTETPYAAKAFYRLGFIEEVYLSDEDAALLHYEEFLKRATDTVVRYEVKKRMALIYLEKKGNFKKAIESYEELIGEDPRGLESDFFHMQMARAYFASNDFSKAREIYQSVIEKFPKSAELAEARFEVGNTYYMERKYRIAIAALEQVLRLHSRSHYGVEAQFLLGECYDQQGNYVKAMEMFEGLKNRYEPEKVLDFRLESVQKKLKKKDSK